MVFKKGKCYRHTTGDEMKIVGEVNSTLYGKCLIGEQTGRLHTFVSVGRDKDCTANWTEIIEEEWMKNFN